MDMRLNSSLSVSSNTESKEHSISENNLKIKGLKRELEVITSEDSDLLKRQVLDPAVTCRPEEKINDRSITSLTPFFYSKTNTPNKMIPWSDHFECIYQSLAQQKHLEIEAQLNALSDVQIQSLFIVTRPTLYGKKRGTENSLLEMAIPSKKAGRIFFRVLFDRLPSEELRHALLESFDDNGTLLHLVCCVMDEPLFKKLEEKLDRQTLLEMVTQPINDLAPPLAFACLYNKSTYLLDTVIHENRELIEKLLKGGPDIDQSLLQFMCNDLARPYAPRSLLTRQEYHHRIKYLLDTLTKQDRFDAVLFTGKSNKSPLLWACTKTPVYSDKLVLILTETLDDAQKAELLTAQAETGNSLMQKCLELKKLDKIGTLCTTLSDPLLRFKVLSICTLEGHSFLQQWLLNQDLLRTSDKEYIENMLLDMDDNHRDLIIAGDRCIWDQTIDGTDHKDMTRQQEQTPIVDAMNRKKMCLAEFLWEQIADPELQIKLLLYKTRHQTTLLQHMLDNEDEWQYFNNRLRNTHSLILNNSFAAELYTHAIAAGRFDYAGYYFSQIIDSKLKSTLFNDNHKYFLLDLCKKSETITESFFCGQTPSQCTESVIYILEHSLYDQKPLMANLLQLITLQEKAGNKDAFVKWVTSPQQGKQCPLITTLSRLAIAYRKMNYPDDFLPYPGSREHRERQVCLNMQIFQGMVSMMSEEQIKEFFLSLQDESYNALHLLGYKDILETIVDTLGDSGRAFLEQINPATGGNLLHILFKSSFINHKDIKLNDLINIVDWLDKTYGLTPFLQGCLENDGSTPLHLLLSTVNTKLRCDCLDSLTLQEHILKQLCQPNADGLLLVELLKLKDNNGCTPLHKFFSCKNINKKIDDLLIYKLGHETFFELMHIKDKQGNTVMDHCSKLHKGLHEKYSSMFQTLPTAVEVQELGSEASARI